MTRAIATSFRRSRRNAGDVSRHGNVSGCFLLHYFCRSRFLETPGMLPTTRQPGRCIYCAFRARQYSLASKRLPRRNRSEGDGEAAQDGRASFTIKYQRGKGALRQDVRNAKFAGRTGDQSIVRKFFKGGYTDKNPWEEQQDFRETLRQRLGALKDELRDAPLMEQLGKERQAEGLQPRDFNRIWNEFERKLLDSTKGPMPYFGEKEDDKSILQDLRQAYRQRKEKGLDGRIKYHFYGHITGSRFTKSDIRNQQALADLRYPTEWFPATRAMHRSIHLHVGPTNSGKTYHALQRLEQATSGVYAGPLRLLAHEVYTRMNAKGKPCSLVTGEERRGSEDGATEIGSLSSCTVEMMPLNKTVDVAVIDEIQMLGNKERGWAWTQALLGVKAREVHLCGEARTVPLVKELCASVGEKLEIHRYERLSPLEMADRSLDGKLNDLRKGDCVVSFSVMGIHALRRQIERATGKKVATVYGSLPPETRAQQARLFNDPDNDYDYLVASDAVGMGLNLAIKRIIFEASSKYDGVQRRTLGVADIKQIAGRAGRYRTAAQANQEAEKTDEESMAKQDLAAAKGEHDPENPPPPPVASENTGFVTTLESVDFPIVQQAMQSEPEPIKTAGLFPPGPVLERFSSYFPTGTPFSFILTRLHELSQVHSRFHLCGLKDQIWVADLIEPVKGLTVGDRNVICSSPAAMQDMALWKDLMPAYAKIIAEQSGGNIIDIPELPLEILETKVDASREYLRSLESLHKGIVCYLWLSYRFAGVFGTRAVAFHIKGMVEERIEAVLSKFSFSEQERRKIAARREKSILRDLAAVSAEDEESAAEESYSEDDADADAEVREEQLDHQTTLTSGGDHLSGEEDVMLKDPAIEAELAEDKPTTTSFAKWRRQQTRGESQGSHEPDPEKDDGSLMGAALEGENAAREGDVELASEERPAAIDIDPAAAAEMVPEGKEEFAPPTGLAADLDSAPSKPETELSEEPLPTQAAAPAPLEPRAPDDEVKDIDNAVGGQNQEAGVPPKHLAHMEVNVSELERNEDSRP